MAGSSLFPRRRMGTGQHAQPLLRRKVPLPLCARRLRGGIGRLSTGAGIQGADRGRRLLRGAVFCCGQRRCLGHRRIDVVHRRRFCGRQPRCGRGVDGARSQGPAVMFQLLEVPAVDLTMSHASIAEFGDGYYLSKAMMQSAADYYLVDPSQASHPYVSPLFASDLSGLPAAYVMTAEFDPLRDEGEAYAARLSEAGVVAEVTAGLGHIHGGQQLTGVWEPARRWAADADAALAAAIAGRPPLKASRCIATRPAHGCSTEPHPGSSRQVLAHSGHGGRHDARRSRHRRRSARAPRRRDVRRARSGMARVQGAAVSRPTSDRTPARGLSRDGVR